MAGNSPNVRNALCHRTDYLHRKVLHSSVASVDFTCIFEICSAEKLVVFFYKEVDCVQIFGVSPVAILQVLSSSILTTDTIPCLKLEL